MKRTVACLCILLLLVCGTATAERVMVPVWRNEGSVDVEMEIYESALGFSVAYDPIHFLPGADALDMLWSTDAANAFLLVQSVTDWTARDLADGLKLQSGADDCTVSDVTVGGLFCDPIPAVCVRYEEKADGIPYDHSFFLISREADVLQVECYYPLALDEEIAAQFTAMMQTLELYKTVTVVTESRNTDAQLVQCSVCGKWFEAGNVFRNHICTGAAPAAELVQCEVCGKWFEAGNVFRNHICTGAAPAAELVQCEVCGKWFEAGNVFRNHICTGAAPATELVQCEVCGEWFEAGNEFRNHICTGAAPAAELVQCEVCGEWFEAGNEFRNHVCTGAAPAAELVQCEVCGEWFEAGNEFRNHSCVE